MSVYPPHLIRGYAGGFQGAPHYPGRFLSSRFGGGHVVRLAGNGITRDISVYSGIAGLRMRFVFENEKGRPLAEGYTLAAKAERRTGIGINDLQ
jgi:hypothetical protein